MNPGEGGGAATSGAEHGTARWVSEQDPSSIRLASSMLNRQPQWEAGGEGTAEGQAERAPQASRWVSVYRPASKATCSTT